VFPAGLTVAQGFEVAVATSRPSLDVVGDTVHHPSQTSMPIAAIGTSNGELAKKREGKKVRVAIWLL
jgi:hypothetical protein